MNRYEALQHAVRAHRQDMDWGGQLYVLHPMAVADRIEAHWPAPLPYLDGELQSAVIVALLHDVLEDTKYMLDPDDFTFSQWRALQLVTRDPSETYFDYMRAICAAAKGPWPAQLAAVVKLADLSHNMSAARMVGLNGEQLGTARRLTEKRYIPSRDMLWEALGTEWWPDTTKGVFA